ncbi:MULTISPECIES: hypothetical protein [Corallincola]|uniref:Uncharacterized protein n=2 Tax=Corallincola TaxID=1775176 RepID=A0ABY1WLQ5_9GAMM|nr:MULTISPECIES: hypothetical protein [Corallincola]TAA41829.1 hypothetical protein EXY25_16475 [Corallincola spongiicola]TCI02172.1 hypothetical protein EZV61_14635 [Corallincola luteus]
MSHAEDYYGPTLYLVMVIACGAITIAGYPAAVGYLLLIKLVYSVVVSMIIHRWRESSDVLVESEENRWMANLHGIPVKEVSNALKNLHFTSEDMMVRRYQTLLLPKFILISLLTFSTIQPLYQNVTQQGFGMADWFGVVLLGYLCFQLFYTFQSLMMAKTMRWEVNRYLLGEHTYYSAFTSHKKGYFMPFLDKVFR